MPNISSQIPITSPKIPNTWSSFPIKLMATIYQRIFSLLIAAQIPPSIYYCTPNTKHYISNITHFISNIKHFIPNTIYNVNFTSPHFVGDHNLSLYFPTTLSLNYQIFQPRYQYFVRAHNDWEFLLWNFCMLSSQCSSDTSGKCMNFLGGSAWVFF